MMNNENLAEFHGVNLRSTYRWTPETKRKKTVQAQADVTPDEWRLIGEIMQLVYLYNAKGWVGGKPVRWCGIVCNSIQFVATFYGDAGVERELVIVISYPNATVQMELLKRQLEQLVYGGEK